MPHHQQHTLHPNGGLHHNKSLEDKSDTVSLPGERSRRKFREVLTVRELMLKKKELSTQDLSNSNDRLSNGGNNKEDDLGNGLFDRFSLARKTLDRSSIR